MTRQTVRQLTAILTRLLYFVMAAALLVALLFTLERRLPLALSSEPVSSPQLPHVQLVQPGTWETYRASPDGLVSDYVRSIAVDGDNIWFGTNNGVSVFDIEEGTWTTYGLSLIHI